MVAAIENAGEKPKYTEYKGVGHNAWSQTYSNDDVMKWMFSQKRSKQSPAGKIKTAPKE